MSATNKVYLGSIGTAIVLDCGQDISAATARSIDVKKPDGDVVSWAAVAEGTNSIKFITVGGSLDQTGKWRLQARVTMPTGTWPGDTATLIVYGPFA